VGGGTGWSIGIGAPMVGLAAAVLVQLPFLPTAIGYGLMLTRPMLLVAAVMWAIHRLWKIEASRSTPCVSEPTESASVR
jgi:hypothetical protein